MTNIITTKSPHRAELNRTARQIKWSCDSVQDEDELGRTKDKPKAIGARRGRA